MIDLFEEDFQRVGYRMTVNKISAAMFFIALCYGGFRRFEMVCTDLGALRYNIRHCESIKDLLAVLWPIAGRFKNEHGVWRWHYIPIDGVTGLVCT